MTFLFKVIKKLVVSVLLIYSFNVFSVSLGFIIPINFITIFFV